VVGIGSVGLVAAAEIDCTNGADVRDFRGRVAGGFVGVVDLGQETGVDVVGT
jgi:hypothetical protein